MTESPLIAGLVIASVVGGIATVLVALVMLLASIGIEPHDPSLDKLTPQARKRWHKAMRHLEPYRRERVR